MMLYFCYTPKGNISLVSENSAIACAKAWPEYIYFVAELAPVEDMSS